MGKKLINGSLAFGYKISSPLCFVHCEPQELAWLNSLLGG